MGKLIIMKLTYLFILFSSIICNSQTIKGVVKKAVKIITELEGKNSY